MKNAEVLNNFKSIALGTALAIVSLMGMVQESNATHAMGMDIRYEAVPGTNKYVVELFFYRDCSGVGPPGSAGVRVASTACGFSQTVTCSKVGTCYEVSPLCPPALANSACNGGSNPGVQLCEYRDTIDLGANYCADFVFSYSLCCRNSAITNLSTLGSQYVEATLDNRSGNGANTSPEFFALPTPYICANQTFNYNHGAADSDGDSLSYTLCNALSASNTNLTYAAGYSAQQPLSSNPQMLLDSLTGQLTMNPNTGQFAVVTMCITEWRGSPPNDSIIGTTMRDLQVVVQATCANSQPEIDSIANVNEGVKTGLWSVEICQGDTVNFDFSASDANGDNVNMKNNVATAIPDATFSSTGQAPVVTGTFSWRAMDSTDIGNNTFVVEVNDDGCPILGANFYVFTIYVLDGTSAGRNKTVCGDSVQLGARGGSNFTWTAVPPASTATLSCTTCRDPKAFPAVTSEYIVTSDLSALCDSIDTVMVIVPTPWVLNMSVDTTICLNQLASLRATPSITRTFTWDWTDPDTTLSDSTIERPYAAPEITFEYHVTVTSDSGCSANDSVTVTISGSAPRVIASGDPDSICSGDTVTLLTSVSWSPPCDTNTTWSCSSTELLEVIGLDTNVTMYAMAPYYRKSIAASSFRHQFIYAFGELSLMGIDGGSMIKGFAYNFRSIPDSTTDSARIYISCTSSSTFTTTSFLATGDHVADIPSINTMGWNMWNFDTGFVYDGASHVLIEICTNESLPGLGGNPVPTQAATFYWKSNVAQRSLYVKNNGNNGCSQGTGLQSYERPSTKFKWCGTAPPDVTYTWFPTSGFTAAQITAQEDTLQNPTVYPVNTALYYVNVVDTDFPACVGQAFVNIFVGDTFSISVTATDILLCEGESTTLTVDTSVAGNYLVNWTPGWPLFDSTAYTTRAYPNDTTMFVVEVGQIGCLKSDSVEIFTLPSPPNNLTIGVSDAQLCAGENAQLLISGGTGSTTYSWTPTTGLSDSTIANPVASPTSTITYLCFAAASAGACDTILSQQVSVGPRFPVDVQVVGSDTVCLNDSVQLAVTSDSSSFISSFVYNWNPSAVVGDTASDSPMAAVTSSPMQLIVTVSHALYGCDTVDTVYAYLDTVKPYIHGNGAVASGTTKLDTSKKVNDSTYDIWMSKPILCSSITAPGNLDFDLDTLTGTGFAAQFPSYSIDTAIAINCTNDTTYEVRVTLSAPLPSGFDESWMIVPHISTGVTDDCGNVIRFGGPGAQNGWGVLLPVELLYFTANTTPENQVILNWESAAEKNLNYYEVQRSKDGTNFEQIGIVPGRGSNNEYALKDYYPNDGVNYYRLKMWDKDGTFEYSHIAVATIAKDGFRLIRVKPIPTTGDLNVQFASNKTDQIKVDVFNLLGELVIERSMTPRIGNNAMDLQLENLEAGVYYLSIYYENNSQVKLLRKVIKQ